MNVLNLLNQFTDFATSLAGDIAKKIYRNERFELIEPLKPFEPIL
jgi:hypothetical protein